MPLASPTFRVAKETALEYRRTEGNWSHGRESRRGRRLLVCLQLVRTRGRLGVDCSNRRESRHFLSCVSKTGRVKEEETFREESVATTHFGPDRYERLDDFIGQLKSQKQKKGTQIGGYKDVWRERSAALGHLKPSLMRATRTTNG